MSSAAPRLRHGMRLQSLLSGVRSLGWACCGKKSPRGRWTSEMETCGFNAGFFRAFAGAHLSESGSYLDPKKYVRYWPKAFENS